MFGLSIEHLLILAVAALFILGPEQLPSAAVWLGRTLRRLNEYSASAQQLRAQLGPEFDELRQPLHDLRRLRSTQPGTMAARCLFNEDPTSVDPATLPPSDDQTRELSSTIHVQNEQTPFDLEAT